MVTKGDIIKYGVLPGIIPRLLEFFRSGFAHVSYLLAFIYQSVGLLPANHVYLKSESFGRFGIRHVVAEAANNLVFSRKHIDQIIVFIVMLAGLVILFSQFIVCGVAMFVSNPVMAITIPLPQVIGESPFGPDQDIAFILLDRVFGVAGWGGAGSFFESCVGLTAACEDMYGVAIDRPAGGFPWTFHTALHRLFEFLFPRHFLCWCVCYSVFYNDYCC